jgi:hypothetical protein
MGTQEGELFLHLYIGKNLLKWNIRPISIKLGTNISCMIGIQIYSNEGSSPLQRGNDHKNRVGSSKYFLLMNHITIKTQIYTSASLYSAESILFNSWSLGIMRGHNKVKHGYICFNGGKSLKMSRNHWAKAVQIHLQGGLMENQVDTVVKGMVPEHREK